jgi:hypothetical protein
VVWGQFPPGVSGDAGRQQRELLAKRTLMKFNLLSYRFGALASLYPHAAAQLTVPNKSNLLATFRRQQRELQDSDGLRKARNLIERLARQRLGEDLVYVPGNNAPPVEEPEPRSVRGLKPPFGKRRHRQAARFAAVFPRDRLTFQLSQSRLTLRVRAAVTACALEDARGFPKLWWTFEAIPANPENGDQLSLLQAVRLLRFARELEHDLLDLLKEAYFETLSKVTDSEALRGELLDRLHVRCVDTEDEGVAELIEALRFRVSSPAELRKAEGQSLKTAKRALDSFDSFIRTTNDGSAIDPSLAETETRLPGVEGITARNVDLEARDVSIAAMARIQGEPTPYDGLPSIQQKRLDELNDDRSWHMSPARRLGAELANDAAQELDDLRHSLRQRALEPVPS